jgi:hypothetical protein
MSKKNMGVACERPQVYLHLFHGRTEVAQNMDDWGADGPLLGPLEFAHVTYASDIKTSNARPSDLRFVGDCVYYDNMYYGAWSVVAFVPGGMEPQHIDKRKATPPSEDKRPWVLVEIMDGVAYIQADDGVRIEHIDYDSVIDAAPSGVFKDLSMHCG